ncbi:MAG: hypothetical protein ACI8W8_004114 [Rhodothermales bacterium]|jgi:hypothetical protein
MPRDKWTWIRAFSSQPRGDSQIISATSTTSQRVSILAPVLCGTILSVLFLSFITGATWLMAKGLRAWHRMSNWVETPARVLSYEDGRMTYAYVVQGQEYRSHALSLRASKLGPALYEKYRQSGWPCYVNPRDPTEAIWNRHVYSVVLWALSAVIFTACLIGFGGIILQGSRSLVGMRKMRHRYPREPCKWRREWQGPIASWSGHWVGIAGWAVVVASLPYIVAAVAVCSHSLPLMIAMIAVGASPLASSSSCGASYGHQQRQL